MLAMCMRYTNSKEEAEEVLINGFVKIFNKLESYSGEGNFEGWMRKIFVREAYNYRKKFTLKWTRLSLLDIDAAVEQQEYGETDFLLKKLQSLPKGYKTVFNLYAIEGYKHKEIAMLLNISESTSKTQFRKAKNMLQNLCKDEYRR
jgi:RNA polymerase sigma factor (sigma-70 family)